VISKKKDIPFSSNSWTAIFGDSVSYLNRQMSESIFEDLWRFCDETETTTTKKKTRNHEKIKVRKWKRKKLKYWRGKTWNLKEGFGWEENLIYKHKHKINHPTKKSDNEINQKIPDREAVWNFYRAIALFSDFLLWEDERELKRAATKTKKVNNINNEKTQISWENKSKKVNLRFWNG
jgi:hypothetical protein